MYCMPTDVVAVQEIGGSARNPAYLGRPERPASELIRRAAPRSEPAPLQPGAARSRSVDWRAGGRFRLLVVQGHGPRVLEDVSREDRHDAVALPNHALLDETSRPAHARGARRLAARAG